MISEPCRAVVELRRRLFERYNHTRVDRPLRHDLTRGLLGVAPLAAKRAVQLLGKPATTRNRIGLIAELDQGTSRRYGLTYYRARLLIDRSWLEVGGALVESEGATGSG